MAPQVGLEPTTTRLTAECSAIELLGNASVFFYVTQGKTERLAGVLQVINLALGLAHLLHLWSHQWDSNPQPTDYKSVALPIALWWQKLLLCSLILQ